MLIWSSKISHQVQRANQIGDIPCDQRIQAHAEGTCAAKAFGDVIFVADGGIGCQDNGSPEVRDGHVIQGAGGPT